MDPGDALGRELSTAVVLYHQAIADRLGLSATEWKALDVLHREGAVTAGRLAELTDLSTGAITGIVDRLARAGRAQRLPDPADRRRVIVRAVPDPELERTLGGVFGALGAAMAEVTARYDPHELEVIADWVTRTIATLREQTRRLRDERP
jgi:predicted transcriptional regulator